MENGIKEKNLDLDSSIKVKITQTTHIQPRKKIGRRECQLITFDLPYLGFFYNQKLLIYKANGDDFEEIVKKLKEGLSVVLEEFYQLAGKLGRDDDGVFKVMYDDDMDGVEVLDAIVDVNHDGVMVSVDELSSKDEFTMMKDLVPYNGILNLEGLQRPLLAIQFTKLGDGLAIGLAFNHAVLDGSATWHFMSSWAELCDGAQSISKLPVLDRVKVRPTRVSLEIPDVPPQPDLTAAAAAAPKLREKLFKFSGAAIEKIKAAHNAVGPTNGTTAPAGPPFSTFQALSSHLWRAVTKARELKPEEPTVFTIFADCRKRVDPPMPESYFGNLIQAIFTGTAAGLLLGHPPEFSAGMVKAAIGAHDNAAIDKRCKEWEDKPIIFQYKDAGMNCVAVGSSPRFKVYDVDFGFGKPERVRSGANNRFDGMVYLYPEKDGGKGIDVEISLETKAMDNLERDKKFLMDGEVV
ncbi:BAHD acyltransferase DCR-like [Chenopodium quinoa]|uniref:anthranilate N-benzoyltransferase n=1 Tax=Chenopodium quinoa TaxID=63459 RepID=A0A803MKQ1_CHEQI|nr:BAHD acyltransferase DCR-like [Chenopodium quinoa]